MVTVGVGLIVGEVSPVDQEYVLGSDWYIFKISWLVKGLVHTENSEISPKNG